MGHNDEVSFLSLFSSLNVHFEGFQEAIWKVKKVLRSAFTIDFLGLQERNKPLVIHLEIIKWSPVAIIQDHPKLRHLDIVEHWIWSVPSARPS